MKKVTIGSVSSGTLRIEDLGPVVLDVAEEMLEGINDELLNEAREANEREWSGEFDSELLEELVDAITEQCPPYVYFGPHHDDPADYGFWPDFDSLSQDIRAGIVMNMNDEEVPEDWLGYVVEVNDHGNVTLFKATDNGLEELWSCV